MILMLFIQYGFLRIRFFSGILCPDFIWFSFDSRSLNLHTYSIVLCLSGETVEGSLIFLSYILCPLSVGVLGSYVVNVVQIHLLTFLVMILMILVSYLPPSLSPLHQTKSVRQEYFW